MPRKPNNGSGVDPALLAKVFNPFPERKPGWHTLQEIADAAGIARQTVENRMTRLLKAGECERERVMIETTDGRKAPCWVYRSLGGGSCTTKPTKRSGNSKR